MGFRLVVGAACAVLAFSSIGAPSDSAMFGPVRKKCIGFGWEFKILQPADYVEYADAFDRTGLDGCGICLAKRSADGKGGGSCLNLLTEEAWPEDLWDDQVPLLQKMKAHRAFQDCFLLLFRTPSRRLSWTDDAEWKRIDHNARILARAAAKGGVRGFYLDHEDYTQIRQFFREPGDPVYERLAPIVRRRARDLFSAVFREHPKAVVFSFWLLSHNIHLAGGTDPAGATADSGELWPAFVNGIFDALPSEAALVDGNEWAYDYENKDEDFVRSALWQRETALGLVAPENRQKYRGQCRAGFGHYLQTYVQQDPKNRYYFGPVEGSRLRHLERNVSQSLACAGEYVWFWGETYTWVHYKPGRIPPGWHINDKTWEEWLPGLPMVLCALTHPEEFLVSRSRELKAKGELVNLVSNSTCRIEKSFGKKGYHSGEKVSGFGTWQEEAKWVKINKGTFGVDDSTGDGDDSSLCAEGVGKGCFMVKAVPVRPGEFYAVVASSKGERGFISINWQKDGKWRWFVNGQGVAFKDRPGTPWRRATGLVRIPDGVDTMCVNLGVRNSEKGRTWFDNVGIYRLLGDPYPDAVPQPVR